MEGAQFTRLNELLRMSDIVIVTCTLTPETTGMFNREAFSLMKKTASFINISRCDIDVQNEPIPRSLLLQKIVGKDALFCLRTDKVDAQLLDAAGPALKVVGTMSVGYDHIDVDECQKRRISVGNTPHELTDSTAELGIALLLATRRRLFEARSQIDSGAWAAQTSWSPMWMCGSEIRGTTVGFVGMGNIGKFGSHSRVPRTKLAFTDASR
ncbi:glyoxylate reductase/hydroxypyruvate reductase [Ixodes scapularis]|uniref:glyoxylate reductase/hydroxypyruvate reductase n=1 Tax=Ixodes scapularis TaxID=6945 RepID=UPI001A9D6B00|nr:glyoxylate reductase/hydroxypyruvate reductase [Ixodes scapularis]